MREVATTSLEISFLTLSSASSSSSSSPSRSLRDGRIGFCFSCQSCFDKAMLGHGCIGGERVEVFQVVQVFLTFEVRPKLFRLFRILGPLGLWRPVAWDGFTRPRCELSTSSTWLECQTPPKCRAPVVAPRNNPKQIPEKTRKWQISFFSLF